MRVPKKTLQRARELRRRMTLPEVVLWDALRKGRLSRLRFRRQNPLGPYVLDFYLPSARLAIELTARYTTALRKQNTMSAVPRGWRSSA